MIEKIKDLRQLKKGDRVLVEQKSSSKNIIGYLKEGFDKRKGIVLAASCNEILVQFDDWINGHSGSDTLIGKEGHCWWIYSHYLRDYEISKYQNKHNLY